MLTSRQVPHLDAAAHVSNLEILEDEQGGKTPTQQMVESMRLEKGVYREEYPRSIDTTSSA
jgi:hypothetical protein